MTLNHAARLLTATLTVGSMVGFVLTGSLMLGLLVLAAPLPMMWANVSERQTWSLGEVLRGRRDDQSIADALDARLRAPIPTPGHDLAPDDLFVPDCPALAPATRRLAAAPDPDGEWFLPDCPPLPRSASHPAPTPTAPTSTPIR